MATFKGNDVTISTERGKDVSRLSNRQYVQLGRAISSPDMESIAVGYLNFDEETIKSLRYEHRGNTEAFNRDILRRWVYQNPGPDQVEVRTGSVGLIFTFTARHRSCGRVMFSHACVILSTLGGGSAPDDVLPLQGRIPKGHTPSRDIPQGPNPPPQKKTIKAGGTHPTGISFDFWGGFFLHKCNQHKIRELRELVFGV